LDKIITKYLKDSKSSLDKLIKSDKKKLIATAKLLIKSLNNNKKILICGNGGSASDSQHFAAELVGRFKKNRKSFPAISLNTDTSAITAIGNDYGFSKIFSRQIEGIGNKGDILFAISTSGNSKNIIEAAIAANKKKIKIVGLTGKNESDLEKKSNLCIKVPSNTTAHIQELHIIVIHLLCSLIEFEILDIGKLGNT